jgi:dipeptidyl aminopeptidase/acylaminoacyl peptidase
MPSDKPHGIVLMHGTVDCQVPVENARLLKDAGGENVQLDVLEDADHMVVQGDGSGPEDESYRRPA